MNNYEIVHVLTYTYAYCIKNDLQDYNIYVGSWSFLDLLTIIRIRFAIYLYTDYSYNIYSIQSEYLQYYIRIIRSMWCDQVRCSFRIEYTANWKIEIRKFKVTQPYVLTGIDRLSIDDYDRSHRN